MQKIKIACTSSGCLTAEELVKYNIDIIPLIVEFQGKEYREGLDISQKHFFTLLENNPNILPKTHMPNTEDIESVLSCAIDKGYTDIIVIGISSGLGGTCSKIKVVGKYFQDKIHVHVFDSRITGFHEGVLAIAASIMSEEGLTVAQIIEKLAQIRENSFMFGACINLDYLIGNGRLRGAQAFLGKTLKICPTLEMNSEGEIVSFKKNLHPTKAFLCAGEKVKQTLENCNNYILWSFSTGQEPNYILNKIEKKLELAPNLPPQTMSLSAGVHAGPYLGGWGIIKI